MIIADLAAAAFLRDWRPPHPLIERLLTLLFLVALVLGPVLWIASLLLVGVCSRQMLSRGHWNAARDLGLWYVDKAPAKVLRLLEQFHSFSSRPSPKAHSILFGKYEGLDVMVLEHESGRGDYEQSLTLAVFPDFLAEDAPPFEVVPLRQGSSLQGSRVRISGTDAADRFSAIYKVYGKEPAAVAARFDGISKADWKACSDWHLEAAGGHVALFRTGRALHRRNEQPEELSKHNAVDLIRDGIHYLTALGIAPTSGVRASGVKAM
ncbi:MAG: hypothetical protein IT428_00465 [Planctomycetaceae bacterium]|nr:hypothetical protein [Planctomycetaceae bacterium]